MTMSDPIADMLTRIRNGLSARHTNVVVPHSKIRLSILAVLESEGYIRSFEVKDEKNNIKIIDISLKYFKGEPAIKTISRVSKPGKRHYISSSDLASKRYYNGLGIRVVSTSSGVMSDRNAIALNAGGELLCNVF